MTACPKCGAESSVGQRWCKRCHSNLGDAVLILASPVKRLGAAVADSLIPGLFYTMLMLNLFFSSGFGWDSSRSVPLVPLVSLVSVDSLLSPLSLIALLLFLAYLIWLAVLFSKGRTPGKLLLNIRVIRADGRIAGFGVMFVRSVVGKFISATVFYLGFIWILIDDDRQGWHDKLVDTFVVENRA